MNKRGKSSKPTISFSYHPRIPQGFTNNIRLRSSAKEPQFPISIISSFYQECQICLGKFSNSNLLSINHCSHQYCQNCLVQYTTYKINVHEQVLCPHEECPEKFIQNSKLYQLLPERIKDRYKEQRLWKQTMDNPNIKLCPRQQCKQGVIDLQMNPPKCRRCQRTFCAKCMMAYHTGSCDDNFAQHFQDYRRCPQCGIMIERIHGCNHMTCRCRAQFCFACGQSWNNGSHRCHNNGNPGNYGNYGNPGNYGDARNPDNIYGIHRNRNRTQCLWWGVLLVILLSPLIFVIGGLIQTCRLFSRECGLVLCFPCVFIVNGFFAILIALEYVGCRVTL